MAKAVTLPPGYSLEYGGLSVSIFFTLLVAPVLFVSLETLHPRRLDDVEEDCEEIEKEMGEA